MVVPYPSDKLVATALFTFPTSQQCAAEIGQQMELFTQAADAQEIRGLDGLYIVPDLIGSLGNFVVQVSSLIISAHLRQEENLVFWRNEKDWLAVEENL